MRTTVNLDDALLAEARRLTGIDERTALLHEALQGTCAGASRAWQAQSALHHTGSSREDA